MNKQSNDYSSKEPTKSCEVLCNVVHFDDFTSNQETNTNWSKMNDPVGNCHDDGNKTFKESQNWFTSLFAD